MLAPQPAPDLLLKRHGEGIKEADPVAIRSDHREHVEFVADFAISKPVIHRRRL